MIRMLIASTQQAVTAAAHRIRPFLLVGKGIVAIRQLRVICPNCAISQSAQHGGSRLG